MESEIVVNSNPSNRGGKGKISTTHIGMIAIFMGDASGWICLNILRCRLNSKCDPPASYSLPLNILSSLCRWGNLPVDDATQFGHDDVVKVLKDYQQVCSQQETQHTQAEHSPKLDTIDGMVWRPPPRTAACRGAVVQSVKFWNTKLQFIVHKISAGNMTPWTLNERCKVNRRRFISERENGIKMQTEYKAGGNIQSRQKAKIIKQQAERKQDLCVNNGALRADSTFKSLLLDTMFVL